MRRDRPETPVGPVAGNRRGAVMEVVLAEKAREQVEHACWVAMHDRVPLETGGTLVGRLDGSVLRLERAVVSVEERTPRSGVIDQTATGGWLDDLRAHADWHLHPGGNPTPSPADLRGWRRGFVRSRPWGQPFWVSAIVTSHGRFRQSVRFYATDCGGTRALSVGDPASVGSREPSMTLPGGWVRKSRRLEVGEEVWWERSPRPGLVQTSYVMPEELAAV